MTNREAFEQYVRATATQCAHPLSEAFISDAIAKMADCLDEHRLWPADVSEIELTLLPPCAIKDDPLGLTGYAGWIVAGPPGSEAPQYSALFAFPYEKYRPMSSAA